MLVLSTAELVIVLGFFLAAGAGPRDRFRVRLRARNDLVTCASWDLDVVVSARVDQAHSPLQTLSNRL